MTNWSKCTKGGSCSTIFSFEVRSSVPGFSEVISLVPCIISILDERKSLYQAPKEVVKDVESFAVPGIFREDFYFGTFFLVEFPAFKHRAAPKHQELRMVIPFRLSTAPPLGRRSLQPLVRSSCFISTSRIL